MLTVDFGLAGVGPGARVLDIGCGGGRHAYEAYRRGAHVVAVDRDRDEVARVAGTLAAMARADEVPPGARAEAIVGDVLGLDFPDGSFDCVIASEVLEHIPEDAKAIWELARLLRPGGRIAVSVPRWWPERICWALSRRYHEVEGGHVRIYRAGELIARLREADLRPVARRHVHALHAPYWWLRCLVGVHDDGHPLTRAYHRMLVWDIMRAPRLTRVTERVLNPLLGKSLVVYLVKAEPADGR